MTGIEPALAEPQSAVLPLDDTPHIVPLAGFEPATHGFGGAPKYYP